MNMNLLAAVTTSYIYPGCSTRKMFWEGIFTLGEFTPVNMKNCDRRNVRKHREIKDSWKYIILDILLKFDSLENIRITSSCPKDYLGRSGKGLITYLSLNTNVRSKKIKKERYAINNVIMNDISNIIKEFLMFPYKGYVWKRPKHEPTDSYFYLSKQLAKYMMITDTFNLHVGPVRTEITGTQQIPILQVCDLEKRKSKLIPSGENLLQFFSTNERESESVIVDEISTEEIESEIIHKSINTNKETYAIDKTEHEEPSVKYDSVINEPRYFNLFECGLNRLDATCKRACIATSRDKYYTEMFNTLTYYNDRNNTPLLNDNI